jgi:hypothetical protein
MKTRIVLSCLLVLLAACGGDTFPAVADAAVASDGIGTSPSDPAIDLEEPSAAGFGDGVWDLVVDYGARALHAALAALAAALAWLLLRVGLSSRWRSLLEELGAHAKDIVLEVFQTYVEALKAARADGKLTAQEKAHAKTQALDKLKTRLGWWKLVQLGGGLLARVFPGSSWASKLEDLLSGSVETAVAEAKREGKTAGLVTSGKDAPTPLPLPPPLPR